MYQNKADDRVLTPAHLLLLPLDSANLVNFLTFKDIGVNTLSESAAFSKIRNATKIYNSNLIHTPSAFASKYSQISLAYIDENSLLTTSSFGVKKQHNFLSSLASTNSAATTVLDSNSFNTFLTSNLGLEPNSVSLSTTLTPSPISLLASNGSSSKDIKRLAALTQLEDTLVSDAKLRLSSYQALTEKLNDNSDKSGISNTDAKVTAQNLSASNLRNSSASFTSSQLNDSLSSSTGSIDLNFTNTSTSSKEFNISGPNSKVLANDQSIRKFPTLTPNKSNFNLSKSLNPTASNNLFLRSINKPVNPLYNTTNNSLGDSDLTLLNTLLSSRSLLTLSHPSVLSSSPFESNSLSYDRGFSLNKTASPLY